MNNNIKLHFLKAGNGDSILINYKGTGKKNYNILIDGGNKGSYSAALKLELISIIKRGDALDLLIVTHIDLDHIGGIIKLFDDIRDKELFYEDNGVKKFLQIKQVWFNANKLLTLNKFLMSPQSGEINESHGADLEMYLEKTDYWTRKFIVRPEKHIGNNENIVSKIKKVICKNQTDFIEIDGAKITLLAPEKDFLTQYHEKIKKTWKEGRLKHQNKNHIISLPDSIQAENNKITFDVLIQDLKEELDKGIKEDLDDTDANLSSIAFIFEYGKKSILFLGDSPPHIISKSLIDLGYTSKKPLKTDYVKLSHHGSIKSISYDLLELIDCNKFIISTNGRNHNLPNKKAIAKIILAKGEGIEFYFNHSFSDYGKSVEFYDRTKKDKIDERKRFKFKMFFSEDEYGKILNL